MRFSINFDVDNGRVWLNLDPETTEDAESIHELTTAWSILRDSLMEPQGTVSVRFDITNFLAGQTILQIGSPRAVTVPSAGGQGSGAGEGTQAGASGAVDSASSAPGGQQSPPVG